MKKFKNFRETNQTCKAGEYYCYTDQKCKPIPSNYKVDNNGMLVKEDDGAAGMMGSAPTNNVGGGAIAGVGVGPAGEPGVQPKDNITGQGFGLRKKKKNPVMGMLKRKVQENTDNNNVMLKQVLDGLDKVDVAIDTMNNPKTEIQVIKEQPKKSFKEKYHVGESIDAALDKYGNTSFDLKKALNSLKPIEKQVIDMRFNNNMTLGEMGKQLNLSVERVRQILYNSIRLLRHPSKGLMTSSEREKILKKLDSLDKRDFQKTMNTQIYRTND